MSNIRAIWIAVPAATIILLAGVASAQEILSDSTDTVMLSASDPFSEHAAGPYSPSAVSRNAPANGLNDGDLPDIRRYAEHVMEQWQIPGLALGIVQDGEPFLVEGFGIRKVIDAAPVDGDTLFNIASMTKAFTTTAISMLAQDGLVDWDEPVVEYYPAFALQDPNLTEQILMRDIVTHRTGFNGRAIDLDLIWRNPPEFYNRYEIVAGLGEYPLDFPIRSQFSYSNSYYTLAGVAMEEVTGKTWEEIIRERIFEPLAMSRSQTAYHEWPDDNYARPFGIVRGEVKRVKYWTNTNIAPAGAVHSSAAEMVKWLMFQLGKGTYEGEEILKSQYFDHMHGSHMPIPDAYFSHFGAFNESGIFWVNTYGLGWIMGEYQSRKIIQHGGSHRGTRGFICMLPDEGFGVVVLTNRGSYYTRSQFAPETLAMRIIDEYLGQAQRDWSAELYEYVWGE